MADRLMVVAFLMGHSCHKRISRVSCNSSPRSTAAFRPPPLVQCLHFPELRPAKAPVAPPRQCIATTTPPFLTGCTFPPFFPAGPFIGFSSRSHSTTAHTSRSEALSGGVASAFIRQQIPPSLPAADFLLLIGTGIFLLPPSNLSSALAGQTSQSAHLPLSHKKRQACRSDFLLRFALPFPFMPLCPLKVDRGFNTFSYFASSPNSIRRWPPRRPAEASKLHADPLAVIYFTCRSFRSPLLTLQTEFSPPGVPWALSLCRPNCYSRMTFATRCFSTAGLRQPTWWD